MQFGFFPTAAPQQTATPRAARRRRETEQVIDFFERAYGCTRLAAARRIALQLGATKDTITLADVRDAFVARYGDAALRSEKGTTYWLGAVFKTRDWEAVGTTASPHNHNDSNRVWKLRTPQVAA